MHSTEKPSSKQEVIKISVEADILFVNTYFVKSLSIILFRYQILFRLLRNFKHCSLLMINCILSLT